jgi:hypothetical protein
VQVTASQSHKMWHDNEKSSAMSVQWLRDALRRRTKRSSRVCLDCSTLRTTTPALHVQVPDQHLMRSAGLGACGGACR